MDNRVVESAKHDSAVLALLEQIEDRVPLQTAPFLLPVVPTNHHDDEIGLIAIKVRQVEAEIAAGGGVSRCTSVFDGTCGGACGVVAGAGPADRSTGCNFGGADGVIFLSRPPRTKGLESVSLAIFQNVAAMEG